jgi:hypothetical protein
MNHSAYSRGRVSQFVRSGGQAAHFDRTQNCPAFFGIHAPSDDCVFVKGNLIYSHFYQSIGWGYHGVNATSGGG